MSIYPTLTDLCGIPTPGTSRAEHPAPPRRPEPPGTGPRYDLSLQEPRRPRPRAGVTFATRTATRSSTTSVRPLRVDQPARDPKHAARKAELAKHLPSTDLADIGPAARVQAKAAAKKKK